MQTIGFKKKCRICEKNNRMDGNDICTVCFQYVNSGIILIIVDDELTDDKSLPIRTGELFFVSSEWAQLFFAKFERYDVIFNKGYVFFPQEIAEMLHLYGTFSDHVWDINLEYII